MKKFIVTLCSLILCLGIVFSFTGCDSNNNLIDNGLTVQETGGGRSETDEMLQLRAYGLITNTTENELLFISVEYKIYDNFGNIIGKAVTHTHNLAVGETWDFKIETPVYTKPTNATSMKFSKIQTIKGS